MTPAAIIKQASADGVILALSPAGTIKATGDGAAVNRWIAVIREHKPEIVAALQEAANAPEAFCFSPPGDKANDDEALQERVAIMMEGNGWNEAKALQEARWQVDKEKAWRVFLRNAKRVLDAPERQREVLLTVYQAEATKRYGNAAGEVMASGQRSWVSARGVH